MPLQRREPRSVVCVGGHTGHRCDDLPERVARQSVVLLQLQRTRQFKR
jgi:hypothetical protein